MQKTKLLFFICSLFAAGAIMAESTTDKVVISELTVEPGGNGDAVFTVSLEGSLKYTAYQISLALPEGLEVCVTDGEYDVYMLGTSGFYPRRGNSHTLGADVVNGVLNVACFSGTNALFSKTSGDLFEVYVKATPYLKPGDVQIGVQGVRLVTVDETKYLPEDYVSTTVQATATSTLSLKVSATNKFGTCILPFDYALPADGSLEAYTCSSHTADALVLEKATQIAAYTPYILYSEAGFSQTISGAVDATKYPADGIVKNGHLVGVVAQTELTGATSYVMQNQGQGPMFYQVDPAYPFVLAAGKCYVELPEGASVSALRIGGTTSIDNGQLTMDNAPNAIYNIVGLRVETMKPGQIYIVNGRKVIAE